MRRDDVRFAAAARDDGIHKISKFTWRAGAAGVVCSALIAVAFGHHVATSQSSTANNGGSSQSQQSTSGSNGAGSNQGSSGQGDSGQGSSNQGSSNQGSSNQGSSNQGSSNQGSSNQGNGGIVVPAQPPAPSQGGGQVTSGAS
jgi:hypothetical protein